MPAPPSSKKVSIVKNDINAESPPRKSRLKFDFPIETLIALSQFRQDEAAKILGVASITLKRNCQRQKYRWPYRTIKAQRRREARLAAQKTHAEKAFAYPSLPPPELLLSLKNASLFSSSPSSTSGLIPSVTSKSMTCSQKDQFSLLYKSMTSELPPQLPPLKLLLQNLRLQSLPATPPRLNTVRPMHYDSVEHKSSFYGASYRLTAPNFALKGLSALVDQYESQERLPLSDFMQSRYNTL